MTMDASYSSMTTLARNWWALILRGISAIIFGLIVWFWPGLALNTLILLFAAFALVGGVFALVAALRSIEQSDRWISLALDGVLGIGAGIVAIVWPDLAAKTFLYLIAAFAIVSGVLEIAAAVRLRREISGEWLLAISGMAAIVFGVIAFIRPQTGALAVLWLIGLYAVAMGLALVLLGVRLRGWGTGKQGITASSTTDRGTSAARVTEASSASKAGVKSAGDSKAVKPAQGARPAAAAGRANAKASAAGAALTPVAESAPAPKTPDDEAQTSSGGPAPLTRRQRAVSDLIAKLPAEGTGWVRGTGGAESPAGYPLKGNATSRIYHAPGGQGYEATIAEIYFATESDAKSAGFRPRHDDQPQTGARLPTSSSGDGVPASVRYNRAVQAKGQPATPVGANDGTRDVVPDEGFGHVVESDQSDTTFPSASAVAATKRIEKPAQLDVPVEAVQEPGTEFRDRTQPQEDDSIAGTQVEPRIDDQHVVEEAAFAEPIVLDNASAESIQPTMPESVDAQTFLATNENEPSPGEDAFARTDGIEVEVAGASSELLVADEATGQRATDLRREAEGDANSDSPESLDLDAVVDQEIATGDVNVSSDEDAGLPADGDDTQLDRLIDKSQDGSEESFDLATGDASDSEFSVDPLIASSESAVSVAGERETGDAEGGAVLATPSTEPAAPTHANREYAEWFAGLPGEGTGWVRGTGAHATPDGFPIKGNGSSRIYHVPGGQNYDATIAEICFVTPDDAVSAGFRPRRGDPAFASPESGDVVEAENAAFGIRAAGGEGDVAERSGAPAIDVPTVESDPGVADSNADVVSDEAPPERTADEQRLADLMATLPPEGTGWVPGDGSIVCPPSYPIKGNASSHIFHVTGGQNYANTIAEICFASPADAVSAGFRPRRGDPEFIASAPVPETATEPLIVSDDGAYGIRASEEPVEPEEGTAESIDVSTEAAEDLDPEVAAIVAGMPSDATGWTLGDGTKDCGSGFPIKGNASSRIFHVPGGRSYDATIPEFCFASEDEAIAAGFRAARV